MYNTFIIILNTSLDFYTFAVDIHIGNVDYANYEEFYLRLVEEILNHFQQIFEAKAISCIDFNKEKDLPELCRFCRIFILGYTLQYLLLQSKDSECSADNDSMENQVVGKKIGRSSSRKDNMRARPSGERTNFWRLLEGARMDYTRKLKDQTVSIFRGDTGVIFRSNEIYYRHFIANTRKDKLEEKAYLYNIPSQYTFMDIYRYSTNPSQHQSRYSWDDTLPQGTGKCDEIDHYARFMLTSKTNQSGMQKTGRWKDNTSIVAHLLGQVCPSIIQIESLVSELRKILINAYFFSILEEQNASSMAAETWIDALGEKFKDFQTMSIATHFLQKVDVFGGACPEAMTLQNHVDVR